MSNHADKRSVATDALETLGTIISEGEKRDAIHLAVEPAIAAHVLRPGEDVGFIDGGVGICDAPVGIVDPFLKGAVKKGERFWLVVYPRKITSLRHVWEHPEFPVSGEIGQVSVTANDHVAESRKWLENFAASIPLAYDIVMDGARDYVADKRNGGWGEYLVFGGLLEGESVPDEFWPHYEIVTGESIEQEYRGSFFSCSC